MFSNSCRAWQGKIAQFHSAFPRVLLANMPDIPAIQVLIYQKSAGLPGFFPLKNLVIFHGTS